MFNTHTFNTLTILIALAGLAWTIIAFFKKERAEKRAQYVSSFSSIPILFSELADTYELYCYDLSKSVFTKNDETRAYLDGVLNACYSASSYEEVTSYFANNKDKLYSIINYQLPISTLREPIKKMLELERELMNIAQLSPLPHQLLQNLVHSINTTYSARTNRKVLTQDFADTLLTVWKYTKENKLDVSIEEFREMARDQYSLRLALYTPNYNLKISEAWALLSSLVGVYCSFYQSLDKVDFWLAQKVGNKVRMDLLRDSKNGFVTVIKILQYEEEKYSFANNYPFDRSAFIESLIKLNNVLTKVSEQSENYHQAVNQNF